MESLPYDIILAARSGSLLLGDSIWVVISAAATKSTDTRQLIVWGPDGCLVAAVAALIEIARGDVVVLDPAAARAGEAVWPSSVE